MKLGLISSKGISLKKYSECERKEQKVHKRKHHWFDAVHGADRPQMPLNEQLCSRPHYYLMTHGGFNRCGRDFVLRN